MPKILFFSYTLRAWCQPPAACRASLHQKGLAAHPLRPISPGGRPPAPPTPPRDSPTSITPPPPDTTPPPPGRPRRRRPEGPKRRSPKRTRRTWSFSVLAHRGRRRDPPDPAGDPLDAHARPRRPPRRPPSDPPLAVASRTPSRSRNDQVRIAPVGLGRVGTPDTTSTTPRRRTSPATPTRLDGVRTPPGINAGPPRPDPAVALAADAEGPNRVSKCDKAFRVGNTTHPRHHTVGHRTVAVAASYSPRVAEGTPSTRPSPSGVSTAAAHPARNRDAPDAPPRPGPRTPTPRNSGTHGPPDADADPRRTPDAK